MPSLASPNAEMQKAKGLEQTFATEYVLHEDGGKIAMVTMTDHGDHGGNPGLHSKREATSDSQMINCLEQTSDSVPCTIFSLCTAQGKYAITSKQFQFGASSWYSQTKTGSGPFLRLAFLQRGVYAQFGPRLVFGHCDRFQREKVSSNRGARKNSIKGFMAATFDQADLPKVKKLCASGS